MQLSAGIVLTSIVSHLFSRYSTSLILHVLVAMSFSRLAEVFNVSWRMICLHCIFIFVWWVWLQHVILRKVLRLIMTELGALPKLHTLSVELRMP